MAMVSNPRILTKMIRQTNSNPAVHLYRPLIKTKTLIVLTTPATPKLPTQFSIQPAMVNQSLTKIKKMIKVIIFQKACL